MTNSPYIPDEATRKAQTALERCAEERTHVLLNALRPGETVGTISYEPDARAALRAALPALYAAWLEEAREVVAKEEVEAQGVLDDPRYTEYDHIQASAARSSCQAIARALTALGPKEEKE